MARPTLVEQQIKRREMSDKQRAYAIWLSTPDALRVPRLRTEMAAQLQVNTRTLYSWDNDPRIKDAARFMVLQNAGDPGNVTEILEMVREVAMNRHDLKAAELWLKSVGVVGSYARNQTLLEVADDALDGFEGFSEEELELMLKAANEQREMIERVQSAQNLREPS